MLAPVGVLPTASMVVMGRSPILPIGGTQERTALSSRCTVQAPHCAMPQPNFVPVRPIKSLKTHKSGIFGGASTDRVSPLILRAIMCYLIGTKTDKGAQCNK